MSETSQNKNSQAKGLGLFKCKKRDRGASEERLINAGLEIFSKHGFSGSTTKMIAKKADVNESLIGRYFDGKEGLLIAITQKFVTELINQDLTYPPQDSLSAELDKYVRDRIEAGCIHEDFARLILSQALVDKKFKRRILETVPMQLDPKLIERVQRLSDLGRLKAGSDVHELCQNIDTYMDGLFFFDRILHETSAEELIRRTTRFVFLYAQLYGKTEKSQQV